MQQAAEIPQREKGVAAPEGVPAKNPTASASAAPAASVSHEVHPQSGRHADLRSSLEGADRRTEPAFKQQAVEILQREKGVAAPEGTLPAVHQASLSRHDHSNRVGESKEGAGGAAAPDKPASAVGSGDAAIGQATPERMAAGGSSDKTLSIGDTVTETPDPAHDHPQSQNTTPHHQARLPERDMFPFRMEMPNVVSPQDTRISATAGASGIEMQAVIDHMLEARQGASNDFGRVRILLNPPDLGAIDLDIIVRRERVQVVMTADNATVQQALQSRGDDVRMALHRHDLKMEGFQVLLQDNGPGQQQTNSGAMYRQNRENGEGFNAGEDNAPPAFPLFSSTAGVKSAEGLVSIFV
jgi:flagellar hook-length control protein FliK